MRRAAVGMLAATVFASGCNLDQLEDLKRLEKAADDLASLAVLVKENQPGRYREAWISVTRLQATSGTGDAVTLYENPNGRIFNLASLEGAGELLQAVHVPPGTYTNFRLTLDSEITLVDQQNQTTTIRLPSSNTETVVNIPANVTVNAGSVTVALDFDVNGIASGAANLATLIGLDSNPADVLKGALARLDGTVLELNGDGTFRLQPASGGAALTISLNNTAAMVDERNGTVSAGGTGLAPGQTASVFGSFDPSNMQVEAVTVKLDGEHPRSGNTESVVGQIVEVKGLVIASSDNDVTLDVTEASFLPPHQITVIDMANATFTRGSARILDGQVIEVKGVWNGDSLTARLIEVEGATPAISGGVPSEQRVVEAKGRVINLQNDALTLDVVATEGFVPQSPLTLDIENVWFKQGHADCLAPGAEVEVKGVYGNNTMTPTIIEVESTCSLPGAGTEDDPASDRLLHEKTDSHGINGDDDNSHRA